MHFALEHIEFLALSEHRVEVLQALLEQSATRSELRDSLGISKATLGRVLLGLEERHWIRKQRNVYEVTATGELVATDFSTLQRTVETAERLSRIVTHLPMDYLGFDLRALADARIVHTTPTNSTAPIDAAVERNRTTTSGRVLTQGFSTVILEAVLSAVQSGSSVELLVTTPDIDPFLEDDSVGPLLRKLVAEPSGRLLWHPEAVPIAVGSHDEILTLYVVDAERTPVALVETSADAVADWFEETYRRYREVATELTVEDVSSVN
ncbi:winged helix-turn-helix domain-containing protein [Haladaptatus sp. DYSN1]|uniref:helix-turn-helix transcriptional regulator n=1 Tax=unclassified Haladaptatus TaxID=2622732 RepID=UPI0024076F5A|nr:hypothetical protein [Haladaptatus sp. DYSN1]